MRDQIRRRFVDNNARVRNLIAVYGVIRGAGQGRSPVQAADVLRSAVIFNHAAIEEVFRGLIEWKFPAGSEGVLNDVPLVGISEHGRPEKFFLGKLASHRAKTVQQLIDESVNAHLGNFSVNNIADVCAILTKIGVAPNDVNAEFALLTEMLARRHHIVHQADRNEAPGQGHHRARSINVGTVTGWVDATSRFVTNVLAQVAD
jgi:hypothetical protein